MAKPKDALAAIQNGSTQLAKQPTTLEGLLGSENIKKRFQDMLGKRAPQFISSIISCANSNNQLKLANPMTIISAAATAASLDLPINPSLGFAHIIPYKVDNEYKAQFQLGWRGYVQLAMRTGAYQSINVSEVYADELKAWNPLTGQIDFNALETWKMRDNGSPTDIVGYYAYFRMLNGFEKHIYWTKTKTLAHGKRYSKSFANGQWSKDAESTDGMSKKTLIKQLLGKWGQMSVQMQRAMETDQAVIKDDGTPDYVDTTAIVEDATPAPAAPAAEAGQPVVGEKFIYICSDCGSSFDNKVTECPNCQCKVILTQKADGNIHDK